MKRLPILLIFFSLFSCNLLLEDETAIAYDYVKAIKKNYTKEEINFFYETALQEEGKKEQASRICKWHQNINLYVNGDTLAGDLDLVRNVIARINNLQLPIHMNMTDKARKANMHIHFGTVELLGVDKKFNHYRGHVRLKHEKGVIKRADVYIFNNKRKEKLAKNESATRRARTISEEIFQALGPIADSYAYPFSLFYERWNKQTELAEIDKRILKLLYEPNLPAGYERKQFEQDFADVLCRTNGKFGFFKSDYFYACAGQHFLDYVTKEKISREVIENIVQYGMAKGHGDTTQRIIKYTSPAPVILQGDTTQQTGRVKKILEILNQNGELLHLYLSDQNGWPEQVGIKVQFRKTDTIPNTVNISLDTKFAEDSLFIQKIGSYVNVTYKDTVGLSEKMTLALSEALYYSVYSTHKTEESPFFFEQDSLYLKPTYAEILKAYYAPELVVNMTKVQLESVLAQMK